MADFFVNYEDSARADALGLDIMPASWGEAASAVAGETWATSPTPLTYRSGRRANYYDRTYTDEFGQEHDIPAIPSKMLNADEANWRYGIAGHLQFDQSTPEPVAQELRQLKLNEIQRQDTLRRSDIGPGTRLTVGLLTSLADPLNIAASFIPVVGEARYAALAERLGPTAARAVTGAVEGAVGAAVIEPLVYSEATAEHADYSMADSMANILFGGLLGAGLHMGAGYIGDRLKARQEASPLQREIDALSPEDQAGFLKTAEAQMAEGRPVDVSPLADASLPSRMADRLKEEPLARGPNEPIATFEQRKAMIEAVDPTTVKAINDIKLETEQLRYWSEAFQKATTEKGPVDEAIGRIHDLQKQLDEMGPDANWRQVRDLQSEIDMLTQDFSSPTRPMKQLLKEHAQRGKKSAATTRKIQRRIDYLESKLPELNRRVAQAYQTAQHMLGQSPAGQKIVQRAKDTAQLYTAPEDARNSAKFEKMAKSEKGLPKTPDEEIASVEKELADLGEFLDTTDTDTAELQALEQAAETEAQAVLRAAGCRLGGK